MKKIIFLLILLSLQCRAENCADFFKMSLGASYHANFLSQQFSNCYGGFSTDPSQSYTTFYAVFGHNENRIDQASAANIAFNAFNQVLELEKQDKIDTTKMDNALLDISINAQNAITEINSNIAELRSTYNNEALPQLIENRDTIAKNLAAKSNIVAQYGNESTKMLSAQADKNIFNPEVLSSVSKSPSDQIENEISKWNDLVNTPPPTSKLKNYKSIPFHLLKKISQANPTLGTQLLTDIKYNRYMELGLIQREPLPLLEKVQDYDRAASDYLAKYRMFKNNLNKDDIDYNQKKFAMTTSYELKKIAENKLVQGDFDKANEGISMARLSLELATTLTPGIATGRGLYEFFSGKSLLTKKDLSNTERAASLTIALIDLTPAIWIAGGVRGAWLIGELGTRLLARGLIKAGFEEALDIGVKNAVLVSEIFQKLLASGAIKLETIKKIVDYKFFFKFLDEEGYLASKFEKDIVEFEKELPNIAPSVLEEEYLANKIAYTREGTTLTTGDAVNASLQDRYSSPPFTPKETVLGNATLEGEKFYRFIGPKSENIGNFMAREKDIVGLDFKQIQEKFALENEPTGMIMVEPDVEVPFFEGPTAPNFGQPGGGWQVYIDKLPKWEWFKNLDGGSL